jgi:hypothetical protein
VNSQLGKPDYAEFLASKRIAMETAGFEPSSPLNPALKPFQAECVHRALVRGRSALFASCGLGKSLIELEWATHVARRSDRPVILLTPLAVSRQFEREAVKFNIDGVKVCKDSSGVAGARIVVTNYERLHHFRPDAYGGSCSTRAASSRRSTDRPGRRSPHSPRRSRTDWPRPRPRPRMTRSN